MREFSRTPCLGYDHHSICPKRKLTSSDKRKPNEDRDIFHGHGIHPVTCLGMSSKSLGIEATPDLRVNTACARMVQLVNDRMG